MRLGSGLALVLLVLLPFRLAAQEESPAEIVAPSNNLLALLSGVLGKRDIFDKAVTDFAVAYADQTERDYDMLMKAARAGRIDILTELDQ